MCWLLFKNIIKCTMINNVITLLILYTIQAIEPSIIKLMVKVFRIKN